MKASGGKTRQIRAELEHNGEREDPCQKIKDNCADNIKAESEKISVEQSVASSVVQKDVERGEILLEKAYKQWQ